jgi:phosphoribosylformimino-5-aminoimidazole carboxamide ribotide isomerase
VRAGARRIIYTDTGRDGTLQGPNFPAFEQVLRVVDVPVIASGGVSSVQDVRRLRALEPAGLEGVIVGRALYEGGVRLEDLLAASSRLPPPRSDIPACGTP